MYNLLRNKTNGIKKLGLAMLMFISAISSNAQEVELNLPNHDDKRYYLGIGLMYNNARFLLEQHPSFLGQDSILSINPLNTGGIGLAGIHTLRINRRFEIRAIFPQLLFSYKNLTYNLKSPNKSMDEDTFMTKQVESILIGLPIHIKFRSDRIGNFRVYMFGGAKIEYDLASNSSARRAENLVKLKSYDFGVEAGIGFNFYFPVFILSPELKISNGIINTHSRDANLKFSNTIDRLSSRMIIFSLIFEG
ncbi:MAG: outer membrane beta-barrel protein [Chitinophagaceae bacterium]|nr:outer membrane beta-barrel protein [Chitinophagaceae bacterium]